VNLAFGEICAHVESDGNPFVVQTANGRAVITGTTFDVKATDAGTTLMVTEGSVQFKAQGGAVQVVAGQQSMIATSSGLPSDPVACNVLALTIWARGGLRATELAQDVSADAFRLGDLPVTLWPRSEIDLDGVNYPEWAEQNEDWFKRQFSWIFDLKEALGREGIKVHYPTLLLQSGDIWRFAYPQAGADRQVGPDPNALLRVASHYGRDESWLKGRVRFSLQATNSQEQVTGSGAFKYWAETIEAQVGACPTRVFLDSLDACLYLVNTRTLAALAIRRDLKVPLVDPDENKILGLLDSQLRALVDCRRLLQELSIDGPKASCGYSDKIGTLVEKIREIGALETSVIGSEKVACHEQGKP